MTRHLSWPDSPVVRHGTAVADALRALGYEVAVVGGAVRDLYLGIVPKDLDLASDAPSDVVLAGLPGAWANAVALRHGTVTVPGPAGGVEITRYRHEVTCDGRHAVVEPTRRLEDDLARRDFTINAMAWRFTEGGGRLEDPFGGTTDLDDGILRAVGDPEQRLSEDALRVLRAYRFAAKYNLEIEPGLAAALDRHAARVQTLSGPRRWMEWERFWGGSTGGSRVRALQAMCDNGACQAAWGGGAAVYDGLAALGRLPADDIPATRALAVLWHRESATDVDRWLGELSPSGRDRREVEQTHGLLQHAATTVGRQDPSRLRRLANTLPREWSLVELGALLHAITTAQRGDPWHASPERIAQWAAIDASTPRSVTTLHVTGQVLMEMDVPRGPALGEMLAWLLAEVVAERVSNTPEALRAAVVERQRIMSTTIAPLAARR